MHKVIFYSDASGNEPVAEYIKELKSKSSTDKNARINFTKIIAYINLLEKNGTQIGRPVLRRLQDEIWELRPLDNRILFATYKGNIYILLHHFMKKTQKTPPQELAQAKRNLKDYIERNDV